MPPANNTTSEKELPLGVPTPAQQSWGTLLSIIVIVLMIIVGAFYAWGKRIAEVNNLTMPTDVQ
jgi:hypothetical protein